MKKQIYFYIIGGVLLLLLFGAKQCQLNKERDRLQIAQVQLSAFNDSVRVFKSKNGELTAKIVSVVVESDNRKKALDAAGFEIKDLKQRNIKLSDVVFAMEAQILAQGSGQTTLHDTTIVTRTDTIEQANFSIREKYFQFDASIINKDVKYTRSYSTGINFISEQKRKSFIVSAYLEDPEAKITTANSITIVPKKKWWDKWYLQVAAGVGVGYLIFK